jgi:hypothetical protein
MRRADQEISENSDRCTLEAFTVSVTLDEARKQVWACSALSGLILLAAMASFLSGTT